MLTDNEYISHSLEFNLFFLRIAKEHTIFIGASLPLKDIKIVHQAMIFTNKFETLLSRAVSLSNGILSNDVLSSGEFITEFTLQAEEITSFLTGVPINTKITKQQLTMVPTIRFRSDLPVDISNEVSILNVEALRLTNDVLRFQKVLLDAILSCKAFSYTYPDMLEHVIEETEFASQVLSKLQNKDSLDTIKEVIEFEVNWTEKMRDHSKYIRGYLDPSENSLFKLANGFANELDTLLNSTLALEDDPTALEEVTKQTINQVTQLRNFKQQGIQGILSCNIKSIIPPLLSDHVLRESNYYLKLLSTFNNL